MKSATGSAAMALGILFALTAVSPTRAQVCTTTCSNYIEGECSEHTTTCTTPPPPPPAYGAIAYGRKSGAWGYSDHWNSEQKAESVAMANCAQNGNDCEVMVWFRNECGAVASDQADEAFWAIGDGEGVANENVLNACAKGGGKGCKIEVSQCSR